MESLPLEGPPPKGHEETLSWLDNGNHSGVIAARDAADREIKKSHSSEVSEISYGPTQAIRIQRDFGRDENGLDLFAIGSPGTAGFTPQFPSTPPTNEILSRHKSPFSRMPSSLDITRFDRSHPSSTVSTPSGGCRPTDWSRLDLPYAGVVWRLGSGYESFSQGINSLNLAMPKSQAAEEDVFWERDGINMGVPVLLIDTKLETLMTRPRAALVEPPSENRSQAHKSPEWPPIVPPYNHGCCEDDSPKLATVLTLASEMRRDLSSDSGSSLDGHAESPTTPAKDSGFGSMTSDDDNKHDVHPESPVIDKLADDNNVDPDASPDSPTSVNTDSTTIEKLIDDINSVIDGIATSCANINSVSEADKLADNSNSHIEARSEPSPPSPVASVVTEKQGEKDYWEAGSDGVSFDVESDCGSSESYNMNQRAWIEPGLRRHIEMNA